MLFAAIDAYLASHHIHAPEWWQITSILVLGAILFSWYHFDSNDRSFSRSKWLNIGVIAIGVLAIPYYLVRSREKGYRLKSLLNFVGMAILGFVAVMLGGALGALVG